MRGSARRTVTTVPTRCRHENWADRGHGGGDCNELLIEQFIASFKRAPEELVLDFDATDDPLHGQQEGRFFHGYYDSYCYLPLYVFCGQQLLCRLPAPQPHRRGASTLRPILKLLVTPAAPGVARGAHRLSWRLGFLPPVAAVNWCERHGCPLHRRHGTQRAAARQCRALARAGAAHEPTQRTEQASNAIFGEFHYRRAKLATPAPDDHALEYNAQGSNPRFVVTNLSGRDRRRCTKQMYCPRGEMREPHQGSPARPVRHSHQLPLSSQRTSCACCSRRWPTCSSSGMRALAPAGHRSWPMRAGRHAAHQAAQAAPL